MEDYGFIYITHNLVDGKSYIGKKNYDAAGYWKRYLGSGVYLLRAIKKFGRENFYREIIDTAKTPDELSSKEKYWIKFYDAVNDRAFYNIATGGDGGNVRAGYTEEKFMASEKKRLKAVIAGRKFGEDCGASKLSNMQVLEIISDLMDGMYTTEIANKHNIAVETIRDIRNHKTWRHMTNGLIFPDIDGRSKGVGKQAAKAVDVYDKDMNYIATYNSAREAETMTGVGYRLISQVCKGERKTSHGYIFMFHK